MTWRSVVLTQIPSAGRGAQKYYRVAYLSVGGAWFPPIMLTFFFVK